LTPRTFTELAADSLLLMKESLLEWLAIISSGLAAGLAVTTVVLLALGLTNMTELTAAISQGETRVVLPLLLAGIADKALNALAVVALIRAAAARDEGRSLGLGRAYSEAAPRLLPFVAAQVRAFLSILWGLCRLIWPGLKLCVLYSFVPLASVVEDLRGRVALERSASVASVDPVKTLGNLAAASAAAAVSFAVLAYLFGAAMTFPQTAVAGGDSLPEAMLLGFVNKLLSGLALGWLASFTLLLYRDLAPGAESAA
jgi:hypothetical protein